MRDPDRADNSPVVEPGQDFPQQACHGRGADGFIGHKLPPNQAAKRPAGVYGAAPVSLVWWVSAQAVPRPLLRLQGPHSVWKPNG